MGKELRMPIKLKTSWVKALRSGKYKQAQGVLEKIDSKGKIKGNCCLGVLCRVAKVKNKMEVEIGSDWSDSTSYFGRDGSDQSLGLDLLKKFRLSANQADTLADMNDGSPRGKSFAYIATWIEKNVPDTSRKWAKSHPRSKVA